MKSKWSLVIHDVSETHVNIWVGTLFSDLRKPDECSVILYDQPKSVKPEDNASRTILFSVKISRSDWNKPFKNINNRFYKYLTFNNLSPNTKYYVDFVRHTQIIETKTLKFNELSKGEFHTLPSKLSKDEPFVIALGSCFYNDEDNGAASTAYSNLYFNGSSEIKPHVKFLTGDQVYLDIGLDSLSPIPNDIRCRIADDYANTWQTQRKMLRNGATWFLADDHEYWNNYPYTSGKNPYLWMITASSKIKKIWKKAAQNGIENVQKVSLVRIFDIGNDISFCFADFRSKRDLEKVPKTMMPAKEFNLIIKWAENLKSPGVIVLPQPLLVKKGSSLDYNLVNYTEQYKQLVSALAHSGHDIICLSGDVHFGRIASVALGNNGAQLHEIISSPMSNLTGLDGKIATSLPKKLKQFPAINITGLKPQTVQYKKHWAVSTQKVSFMWVSPYRKTREHFMTLAFSKTEHNAIKLQVQAWRVREKKPGSVFPKQEFKSAHEFILN